MITLKTIIFFIGDTQYLLIIIIFNGISLGLFQCQVFLQIILQYKIANVTSTSLTKTVKQSALNSSDIFI